MSVYQFALRALGLGARDIAPLNAPVYGGAYFASRMSSGTRQRKRRKRARRVHV